MQAYLPSISFRETLLKFSCRRWCETSCTKSYVSSQIIFSKTSQRDLINAYSPQTGAVTDFYNS